MIVEIFEGKNTYKLGEPVQIFGYFIPAGFEWNGASIPPVFWSLLWLTPYHYKVRRAGLIHDYLYEGTSSRYEADKLFRKALKEDGLDIVRRSLMYFAVRAFGWVVYPTKG